jgi:hypothetical protein
MITRITAYLSYRRFGKNNSCGQVAERLATQQRGTFLKGINYQGFLPVFQFQKADAQIFFYQFIRLCQYVTFELQLMNLLPETLDFTE